MRRYKRKEERVKGCLEDSLVRSQLLRIVLTKEKLNRDIFVYRRKGKKVMCSSALLSIGLTTQITDV